MPSSISSSERLPEHGFDSTAEQRAPAAGGAPALIAGFLLFFLCVALLEMGWRSIGVDEPSLTDDMRLWSIQRDTIGTGENSDDIVALLGGSRMQLGFSSIVFNDMFPKKTLVKLAISGRKPLAALRDLAENTSFSGIVIVDVYTMGLTSKSLEDQQPYVDYYHREWNTDAFLNRQIKSWLEFRLVSMDARLKTRSLLSYLAGRGQMPLAPYLRITPDRSFYADYRKMPQETLHKRRKERIDRLSKRSPVPIAPEKWLKRTQKADEYARRIILRGGHVVFLYPPIDYEDWKKSHGRLYPNEQYWYVSASHSSADFVHFADYPELHFFSPDASHLDMRDAVPFTRNLLEILRPVIEEGRKVNPP